MSGSEAEGRGERIRRGDVQVLANAFEEHGARLRSIVQFRLDSRLVRRVDPADVVQEAYLNAFKRCQHLEGDADQALFVWLRLITLQTLADVHRRHLGAQARDAGREFAQRSDGLGDNTSLSVVARLVGHLTSPSGIAHRAELSERLQASLSEMNDIDREVLALRHFEELSNQEVAAVLGLEQKAASIRYVRALRRLKELLSALPGLESSAEHK